MIIWIDEHLSARLAPWFKSEFNVDAVHIGALGLSSEDDAVIFEGRVQPAPRY